MSCYYYSILLLWLLLPICVSTESIPVSSFLINCGSLTNTSIDTRLFSADVETPKSVFVTGNVSSPGSYYSELYRTARVFNETSHYILRIPILGRYWIRIHFAPFGELAAARFSVSGQNYTLLKDFRSGENPVLKEYNLNVTSDTLFLTFAPFPNSFAFVNAIEVFLSPDGIVPASLAVAGSDGVRRSLKTEALETVLRVNMGNESVSPEKDVLRRSWVGDGESLITPNTKFESDPEKVVFGGNVTENFAPREVYGTATRLDIQRDVVFANLTWRFRDVAPGFEYFVRLHFCKIVLSERETDDDSVNLVFNVFVNHLLASSSPDRGLGIPYFLDYAVKLTQGDGDSFVVSVGPKSTEDSHRAFLVNGLEILRLIDSKDGVEETDVKEVEKRVDRNRIIVVVACLVGGVLIFAVFVAILSLFLCRRRRRKLAVVGSSTGAVVAEEEEEGGVNNTIGDAYFFNLAAVREATDNFSENLVIGVGGFGKVYKGILGDNGTVVAIKRGVPNSSQGLAEFRTEIEMLTQFRHRHLVSLIGYCDERGELIIIYEFMENLTLKEHLYGSDGFRERLSWVQRLRILIGSARGLHYLHTGTAKAIIHRDVKSANILLDENFMAKVADFGLSKAGPEIDKTHVSTAVKGSFGYLDPEYLIMQRLTEKSDVYSFGVVMLEVLCGRAVIDPSLSREKVNLIDWAMKTKTGRLEEILDPCLVSQVKPESVSKFWEIAEKCLAERGAMRPSMGDVLWNLEYVLQLQGDERTNGGECEISSRMSRVDDPIPAEAEGLSAVDLGDLAGVSMSKVFAQMVKEDLR